jgi:5-methylcytosine-specific restriction enzyme subunit McrC
VDARAIRHPDLYQLLAYVVAADLPCGLLIYAAGEAENASHQVIHLGRRLELVTLDLAGSPHEVLGQIDAVASRIKAMRRQAISQVAA